MLFPSVTNYTPSMGLGRELDLIAAVVIGGGSLKGGKAPVLGTVVGSLLIAVIRSGCTQIGVSQPWEYIIIGLIIIAAVLFDRAAGRGD
jgi:ribose/xylose/arabinose/galactoside ABC-type transport system permease subunit